MDFLYSAKSNFLQPIKYFLNLLPAYKGDRSLTPANNSSITPFPSLKPQVFSPNKTGKFAWRAVYVLTFPLSGIVHLISCLFRNIIMGCVQPSRPRSDEEIERKQALLQKLDHTLPILNTEEMPTAEIGFIQTASGAKVEAAFFHAQSKEASSQQHPGSTVILCGGNNGGYALLDSLIEHYTKRGLNVMAFSYRGTGESDRQAFLKSQDKLFEDGQAAFDYVSKTLGVPNQQIIFHGYSLGGAVASHLAARLPHTHLLIDRTFADGASIAIDRAGQLAGFITRYTAPMDTKEAVKEVSGQVGIMAAENDFLMEEVELEHSQRIFDSYFQALLNQGVASKDDYQRLKEAFVCVSPTSKHLNPLTRDKHFVRYIDQFIQRCLPASS